MSVQKIQTLSDDEINIQLLHPHPSPSTFHLHWCGSSVPANRFPLTGQVWVVPPPLLEGCGLVLWNPLSAACVTYAYNRHFSFSPRGAFVSLIISSSTCHYIRQTHSPYTYRCRDGWRRGEECLFVTGRSSSFASTSNRHCQFHRYKSPFIIREHHLK